MEATGKANLFWVLADYLDWPGTNRAIAKVKSKQQYEWTLVQRRGAQRMLRLIGYRLMACLKTLPSGHDTVVSYHLN